MNRMDAVVDRFRAIPELDPRDVDAILYDDNGLPLLFKDADFSETDISIAI